MRRESYEKKLFKNNKLTKRMEEEGLSPDQLAKKSKVSVTKIKLAQKGYEVTGGEAKAISRALHARYNSIWVNYEGMIVCREKVRERSGNCSCKLY